MTVTAFRLCGRSLAETGDALRGEGARRAGGRWNPPRVAAVYTAGSLSLASLEYLAYFDSSRDVPVLVVIRVRFDPQLVSKPDELPKDWQAMPAPRSTQAIGEAWWREQRSAVLEVPSVIIPTEFNYVLNPEHPDFGEVEVGSAEPFLLDVRLTGS